MPQQHEDDFDEFEMFIIGCTTTDIVRRRSIGRLIEHVVDRMVLEHPWTLPIVGFMAASVALEYLFSRVFPNDDRENDETRDDDHDNDGDRVASDLFDDDGGRENKTMRAEVETVAADEPSEHDFWWLSDDRNVRPLVGELWIEPVFKPFSDCPDKGNIHTG